MTGPEAPALERHPFRERGACGRAGRPWETQPVSERRNQLGLSPEKREAKTGRGPHSPHKPTGRFVQERVPVQEEDALELRNPVPPPPPPPRIDDLPSLVQGNAKQVSIKKRKKPPSISIRNKMGIKAFQQEGVLLQ